MNKRSKAGPPALDVCEEALHVLRGAPAAAFAVYYTGTVPFLLGLLFYWAGLNGSASDREHYAAGAFGLALLYVWMQTCHAVFAQRLRSALSGRPELRLRWRDWTRIAAFEATVQPSRLIALAVAILLVFPLASVFAFYHSASVCASIRAARRQASVFPEQNWIFLAIVSMLTVVVFINSAIAMAALPYLAKLLLGIENMFTRSAWSFFNTTFLAAAAALTYLAVNPFTKAFYAVRCFHGESLTSGEDLRVELRAAIPAAIVVSLFIFCPVLRADSPDLAHRLDHSIDHVLQHPEYSWRLPHPPREPDPSANWFVRQTLAFLDATGRGMSTAGRWLDEFVQWLGDRMGDHLPQAREAPNARAPALPLRLAMIAILAALTAVAIYALWKLLIRRRAAPPAPAPETAPVAIDLTVPNLEASDQPFDAWLELARKSLEEGQPRLALRAFYLAGLAWLAGRSLIALNRSKSDRDYARELHRRARRQPDVVAAFQANLLLFERGWYGMYDVRAADISTVQENLGRMRTDAE